MVCSHARTVNIRCHDDWATTNLAVFDVCVSFLGRVQQDIEWFATVRAIDSNLLKLVHQRKFFIGMSDEKTTSDRVEVQVLVQVW